MHRTLVLCLVLAGCAMQEPAPVPVPPMPEDLSTWTAPEWVSETPVLTSSSAAAVLVAPEPPKSANLKVYAWEPGKEYKVPVALGSPADIILEPGEIVHNIVGGDRQPLQEGDAPRWEVKEGKSASAQMPIAHVFLAASHVGQQMGVIVTTDRRTYYLAVASVASTPIRAVMWTYPEPPPAPVHARAPSLVPDGSQPQRYHVGYSLTSPGTLPAWAPTTVLDDGRKTYLIFPATMLYQAAPLVRLLGPQGPQLVNSRQVGQVYIIDQLIGHAELRVGAGEHAEVLTVSRGNVETITCPGHAQCPAWPQRRF